MRPNRVLVWLHGLPTTTFEGKVFVTATLAFGIFAVAAGGNLKLLVLAAMVAVAVVSCFASVRNLHGLTFTRELPESVPAGDEFDVRLTVTNGRRLTPALAVTVRDAVQAKSAGAASPCVIERVPPGSSVTVTYRARVWQRGFYNVSNAMFVTRFPFGLFEKRTLLTAPSSILVTPGEEAVPVGVLVGASDRRRGDGSELHRARGGEEFRGLRDYRAGDPVRRIAWKASAKRGELLIRQLDRRRAERALVLLDPRLAPGGGRGPLVAFEKSIRYVVGLAERARRDRQPTSVALLAPDFTFVRHVERPGGREALLTLLALVEPSATRTLGDVLDEVDPRVVHGARVVVVTGASGSDRRELEERIRRLGGEPISLRSAPRRRARKLVHAG